MRPKLYHGLYHGFLYIGYCVGFIWTPNCNADSLKKIAVSVDFVQDHAVVIISVLLISLLFITFLLIKSRRMQRIILEKNQDLIRSSQTITKYFEVIDKNILSVRLDLNGIITYVSTCFLQRYHHNKLDLLGASFMTLFEDQNGMHLQSLKQAISNKNVWEGELLMVGNSDGSVWAEVSLDIIMDSHQNSSPNGYTLIFNDITNQKLIRHLSETDALTGIYNRYRIDQLLNHEINRQKRYQHNLVVGLIDIDYFKPINDNYGHLVGDEVLVTFVELIKGNIRKVDIFGRWGGEEFIIIYPNTEIDQSFLICEMLRKSIINAEFPKGVPLTASFGITPCREDDTIDSIVHRADLALYLAKKGGRNCTRIVE